MFVNWLFAQLTPEFPFLDIFVDHKKNLPGDKAKGMIVKASESFIFMPILSKNFINSKFCCNERKASKENTYSVEIPILYNIEKKNIPTDLKIRFPKGKKNPDGVIWADFSNKKEWEAKYQLLAKAITAKIITLGICPNENFFQDCEHLDLILKRTKPTNWEIKTIFDVYLPKEEYQRYFFNKLDNPIWLKYFKGYGYTNLNPSPLKSDDSLAVFTPHWPLLAYLEKCSLIKPLTEDITSDVLEIITNVTIHKGEDGEKLDNYRTWWYFVQILLNIPNQVIVSYLNKRKINIGQDWIKEWLASKFDSSIPSSDIAQGLLPKFLTGQAEDGQIAEEIIREITALKWQPRKDALYGQGVETKTMVEAYWLAESFRKNAPRIGQLCAEQVVYDLADKLKEIFKHKHPSHQIDLECGDKVYRIKVSLGKKDFSFLCSVGQMDTAALDQIRRSDPLKFLSLDPASPFNFSLPDCRNKRSFVDAVKTALSQKDSPVDLKKIKDIAQLLTNLYEGLYSDYSSIWVKSLRSGPDFGPERAEELLVVILRDVLSAKCKADAAVGRCILSNFLQEAYQFPIFRRFALFVMAQEWDNYADLFWQFMDVEDNVTPLAIPDYAVEIYHLLRNNVKKFTLAEKEKIKGSIEAGIPIPTYLESEEEKRRYISLYQQRLYLAMKDDAYFAPLYAAKKAETGMEVKPPAEQAGMTWSKSKDHSPLSVEDVLKMPNRELAGFLQEFKPKDRVEGSEGLAEYLRRAAKEKPDKFVEDLEPFLNVNYLYVYNILYGLEEAWKEKKTFHWGKLLCFIKSYLQKPDFFKQAEEAQREHWLAMPVWIINVAVDLIEEGTRDDAWAFSAEYFNQAEEILDIAIEKLPVEKDKSSRDAVSRALNSSFGRVVSAVISLALRRGRVDDKKGIRKDPRWESRKYENLLKKGVMEAYTSLGRYLSNLLYLNKPWVERKISEFEAMPADDIRWNSFMQGYLAGGIVWSLYSLMRPHYLKALDIKFPEGCPHVEQHIAIGYLRRDESLDGEDSLFKRILDKGTCAQISNIVRLFWSQARRLAESSEEGKKDAVNQGIPGKIIQFWRWTYKKENREILKDRLKEDYPKLLSELSRLTVWLDRIDQEKSEWLLLSAPYVEVKYNSALFVEYLDKFADTESITYLGRIFSAMLSGATTLPTYPQERIISIVEKNYQVNKAEADEICNTYLAQGIEFLRPTQEKYNKR